MKVQDAGFFLVLLFLLWRRQARLFVLAGLSCLILAMPLFYFRIFFTAERLTWYGAGFILLGTLYLQKQFIRKSIN